MVSKTSLVEAVKGFDWKAVDAGLEERPDLLGHREEREKNWLHVLCSTKLKGRRPAASIKTADVLLARGIDLHAHAFTEGTWKATPVWWCVSWGRNLGLSKHGARGDIPGPDGKTAIEIMSRKKDERFRKLARTLGGAS